MNNQIRVPIGEEVMMYLERLWFEYQGYLALMTQFTSNTTFSPNKERFNTLLKEYMDSFVSFNLAWTEVITKVIEEKYRDERKYTIDLDFGNSLLKISEKGDGDGCSCNL